MNTNTGALVTLTAAAAGTYNSTDLPNREFRGVLLLVNFTTVTTASVVVTIQGKDAASGQYYSLLASTAITSAGSTILQIAPGLLGGANAADAVLPATWRVSVTITGGSAAVTGTIGASLSD